MAKRRQLPHKRAIPATLDHRVNWPELMERLEGLVRSRSLRNREFERRLASVLHKTSEVQKHLCEFRGSKITVNADELHLLLDQLWIPLAFLFNIMTVKDYVTTAQQILETYKAAEGPLPEDLEADHAENLGGPSVDDSSTDRHPRAETAAAEEGDGHQVVPEAVAGPPHPDA